MTCFCAVQRPVNHPLRPPTYRPLDAFWQGRGYRRELSLQSTFYWPDLGQMQETGKPMVYWTRPL